MNDDLLRSFHEDRLHEAAVIRRDRLQRKEQKRRKQATANWPRNSARPVAHRKPVR